MPLLYHNNNSISNVTSFAQVPSGSPVLLSTATASASSSISFTSGIDSTYDVYQFEFINIHPSNDCYIYNFNVQQMVEINYGIPKQQLILEQYMMKLILQLQLWLMIAVQI
jgi:hypothetical protein